MITVKESGKKVSIMSNINRVQQVVDIIVKLLPTVKRDRAEKLADLIV